MDKPPNQSAAVKTRPETARGDKSPQPPHSAFNRWIEAKSVQQLVTSVTTGDEFKLDVADPIVGSPAVQVLPMAIFI